MSDNRNGEEQMNDNLIDIEDQLSRIAYAVEKIAKMMELGGKHA
jgi:hypothetical protein